MPQYDDEHEPVHAWFGLTYSTHAVLDEARMTHLDAGWREQMNELVVQLHEAFPDCPISWRRPGTAHCLALAAVESEYGELTEAQMGLLEVSTNEDDLHDGCDHRDEAEADDCHHHFDLRYYDWRGDEHDFMDRVMVPVETEQQAAQAERVVPPRMLLQSMPVTWQQRFVQLMEQYDELDVDSPEAYDIRFYTAAGHRTTGPLPSYSRGRTRLTPRTEVLA